MFRKLLMPSKSIQALASWTMSVSSSCLRPQTTFLNLLEHQMLTALAKHGGRWARMVNRILRYWKAGNRHDTGTNLPRRLMDRWSPFCRRLCPRFGCRQAFSDSTERPYLNKSIFCLFIFTSLQASSWWAQRDKTVWDGSCALRRSKHQKIISIHLSLGSFASSLKLGLVQGRSRYFIPAILRRRSRTCALQLQMMQTHEKW